MKRITMFFVLVVISTSASAAIIDSGTFFTDTESDLDWLKWESMSGRSYDYVTDNMDIGEEFYGWSYSLGQQQYATLLCHVFNLSSCTSDVFNAVQEITNYDSVIEDLFGGRGTALISGQNAICQSGFICSYALSLGGYYEYPELQSGIERNLSNPNIGHLLVRPTAVPVPATAWLFGSSLIGLALARRWKQA